MLCWVVLGKVGLDLLSGLGVESGVERVGVGRRGCREEKKRGTTKAWELLRGVYSLHRHHGRDYMLKRAGERIIR